MKSFKKQLIRCRLYNSFRFLCCFTRQHVKTELNFNVPFTSEQIETYVLSRMKEHPSM